MIRCAATPGSRTCCAASGWPNSPALADPDVFWLELEKPGTHSVFHMEAVC